MIVVGAVGENEGCLVVNDGIFEGKSLAKAGELLGGNVPIPPGSLGNAVGVPVDRGKFVGDCESSLGAPTNIVGLILGA